MDNANIGSEISQKQVTELPLNLRNVFNFVELNSSVNNLSQRQTISSGGQQGSADQDVSFFNFGGGYFGTTAFLDGAWDASEGWGGVIYVPSPDNVQEFKVQQNTFSAQYGWSTGNVINVVTKSGGSSLHGTHTIICAMRPSTRTLFMALEWLVFRPVLHEAHPLPELWRAIFLLDAFVRGAGNFFAPVSWAVAVELVMYVLAAVLLAVALGDRARGHSRRCVSLVTLCPVQRDRLRAAAAAARAVGLSARGRCFWLHQRLRYVRPNAVLVSVAECVLVAIWLAMLWVPYKNASWIPAAVVLYAAMVLVFARDAGIVSRVLQLRPLVLLGQLSFALYMVHLFFVILPNRFLPRLFAVTGHADWIAPGVHKFGLESIHPPTWLAVLLTLAVPTLALGTAWFAWRFVEEPARHWTRRFAPHTPTPAVKEI